MKKSKELLEFAAGAALGELPLNTRIADLGIGSLDLVYAVVEFDINLSDEELRGIVTVEDLERLL